MKNRASIKNRDCLQCPSLLCAWNPPHPCSRPPTLKHYLVCRKFPKHTALVVRASYGQGESPRWTAGRQQSSSAGTSKYMCSGPCRSYDLNPILLRVGTNSEGQPVNAQLQVSVPLGITGCPLVIISAGFLLDGSLYRSYVQELATWGYAAVLYDLSEVQDDRQSVIAIRTIVDACTADPQVSSFIDPSFVFLVGHSRGAKLSVLTAALDSRIKALVLIDPVNNTAMSPSGPGYPSALPLLKQRTRGESPLPVLIIGASCNQDVVPEDANYRRFFEASEGPTWLVDIPSGHLQFLDKQVALFSILSGPGPNPDSSVRSISKAAMITWFQEVGRKCGAVADISKLQGCLESEAGAYRQMAPGTSSMIKNLSMVIQRQGAAWSSDRSQQASHSNYEKKQPAAQASYDELMSMRASALKQMLKERGIACADCFDKESLARRALEHSSARKTMPAFIVRGFDFLFFGEIVGWKSPPSWPVNKLIPAKHLQQQCHEKDQESQSLIAIN